MGKTGRIVNCENLFFQFGETPDIILEDTGCKKFNVKFEYGGKPEHDQYGVITSKVNKNQFLLLKIKC